MGYAASLDKPTGHGDLQVLSVTCNESFSQIAGPIQRGHHHESLATLELEATILNPATAIADLGFAKLTTLELRQCLVMDQCSWDRRRDQPINDDDDPFARLPCLASLKLLDCTYRAPIKVTGLRLLSLEISCGCESMFDHFRVSEVLAPKLESFYVSGHRGDFCLLREVDLPSLARAVVRLEWVRDGVCVWSDLRYEDAMVIEGFVRLLSGLRNAESLDLWIEDKSWKRQHSLVNHKIKPLVGKEVSRFTRLKNSKIRYLYQDQ